MRVCVCELADVGRSCILLSLGGKNIMLDCGMHMGYNDSVSNECCVASCVLYVANNMQNNLLEPRLRVSNLFSHFCMHVQLFSHKGSAGVVGLFVSTEVIIPDFMCCNYVF